MQSSASTPEEYLNSLPEDRKKAIAELRKNILENLPEGFSETMNYGMLGYVIPHSKYPAGYHCDPSLPLPFMNIAPRKISLPYIIWEFTLIVTSWNGFFPSSGANQNQNRIWGKVVSGLKKWIRSLIN